MDQNLRRQKNVKPLFFTTESHKLLQGDIGGLFLYMWFLRHVKKSHYYHM